MIYKARIALIVLVLLFALLGCIRRRLTGEQIDYKYAKKYVQQNCKQWGSFFELDDCKRIDYLDSLWKTNEPKYPVKDGCFIKMISPMFRNETDSMNLGVFEAQYFYYSDSSYFVDSKRLREKYDCK